jgi:hypothetical protein
MCAVFVQIGRVSSVFWVWVFGALLSVWFGQLSLAGGIDAVPFAVVGVLCLVCCVLSLRKG